MKRTPLGARRSFWLSYAICVCLALGLVSAWLVGPPIGTWARLQNHARPKLPALSVSSLSHKATYRLIDEALDDDLRVKPSVVWRINEAGLRVLGLSLVSRATTASLVPRFSLGSGVDSNLFISDDFTPDLSATYNSLAKGLTTFTDELRAGGKTGFVVVVPNKSTIMLNDDSFWHKALMADSNKARQNLLALASNGQPLVVLSAEDLRAARPEDPFWTGDTHWKPDTAMALVTAARDRLGLGEGVRLVSKESTVFSRPQDLLAMLSINSTFKTSVNVDANTKVEYTKFNYPGPHGAQTFKNLGQAASGKTALILCDSAVLATGISDELASLFTSGTIAHLDDIKYVDQLPQADVVIIETVERVAYPRIVGLGEDASLRSYLMLKH